MMSVATKKPALYFINLLIDQLWDEEQVLEKIFPTRIPSSIRIVRSYENLAIYLGNPDDLVLGSAETDSGFVDYLGLHKISVPRVRKVKSNPYDVQDWLLENQDVQLMDFETIQVAGLSKLEWQWLKKGSSEPFRRFNSKVYLAHFARETGMPFPETQILQSHELFQGLPPFRSERILKANWGSGGGGSFRLKSNSEPLLKLISARLQGERAEIEWLLQEKLERLVDYCCFGTTASKGESTAPSVWQIEYDQNGSSWRHIAAPPMTPNAEEQSRWFSQLAQRLSNEGYEGPFGIDGFTTSQYQFFPAVDLNVRYNKCHLIEAAAQRFKIPPSEMDSQKLKFVGKPSHGFSEWWLKACAHLGLNEHGEKQDGSYFYPYLVTTLLCDEEASTSDSESRPMEISFFSGEKGKAATPELSNWQKTLHDYLRGLTHAE